jgi:hypothetical protein
VPGFSFRGHTEGPRQQLGRVDDLWSSASNFDSSQRSPLTRAVEACYSVFNCMQVLVEEP